MKQIKPLSVSENRAVLEAGGIKRLSQVLLNILKAREMEALSGSAERNPEKAESKLRKAREESKFFQSRDFRPSLAFLLLGYSNQSRMQGMLQVSDGNRASDREREREGGENENEKWWEGKVDERE